MRAVSRVLKSVRTMALKVAEAPSVAPAFYRSTPPPHHDGTKFKSPWASADTAPPGPMGERGFYQMIKAQLGSQQELDIPGSKEVPAVQDATYRTTQEPAVSDIIYTWLGHAANHVQLPTGLEKRFVVLTDPVFSERCVDQIAQGGEGTWPDVLVLSHNHYDHTDAPTLSAFLQRSASEKGRAIPHILCSLGNKSWFEALGFPSDRITQLDWWEACVLEREDGAQVRFTAVPAQHFAARGIFDRNQTLWSGFTMEVLDKDTQNPQTKVYFAGDTAYRSIPQGATDEEIDKLPVCPAFKEIGDVLGPFDFSMIPIGAYGPRWLFSPVHIGPWEAVRIHKDVRSRKTIGIHWGVWRLTSEPPSEPKLVLQQEAKKADLPSDEFTTCGIGETVNVSLGRD